MKKKIAIVTKQMITGGVERCLVTMLQKYSKCSDVTLFLMAEGGEMREGIPSDVNVRIIPGLDEPWRKRLVQKIKKFEWGKALSIFAKVVQMRHTAVFSEQCRYLASTLPPVEEEFDIAISYYVPVSFPVVYTLSHIKAKKKVLWLHTDLELMGIDLCEMRPEHGMYDEIVSVSRHISKQMKLMEPENAHKVVTVYNCYDVPEIIKKSQTNCQRMPRTTENTWVFLTVGRLSSQKTQTWIPAIASQLKKDGILFKWLIVGDGEKKTELLNQIEQFDVADCVLFLGNKKNPYPYMKNCDIYIQTSRYEGFCTTTFEAKILNKIVLTTDVSGACEQFQNEYDGLIVERSPEGIYLGILRLTSDNKLRQSIERNVKKFQYVDSPYYDKIFGEPL